MIFLFWVYNARTHAKSVYGIIVKISFRILCKCDDFPRLGPGGVFGGRAPANNNMSYTRITGSVRARNPVGTVMPRHGGGRTRSRWWAVAHAGRLGAHTPPTKRLLTNRNGRARRRFYLRCDSVRRRRAAIRYSVRSRAAADPVPLPPPHALNRPATRRYVVTTARRLYRYIDILLYCIVPCARFSYIPLTRHVPSRVFYKI